MNADNKAANTEPFPQRAVVLGASGMAFKLKVDPSPLNDLLTDGWSFVSAHPGNVTLNASGDKDSVADGATTTLVIVEWRKSSDPPSRP